VSHYGHGSGYVAPIGIGRLTMIDWNTLLALGIKGAPAAAVTLFVVWAIWFVVRLFKRVMAAFSRAPAASTSQAAKPRKAVRIEPVLDAVDGRDRPQIEEISVNDLQGAVVALSLRVDSLERQVTELKAPREQTKRTLRVIESDHGHLDRR
jgi:hypothetical protein